MPADKWGMSGMQYQLIRDHVMGNIRVYCVDYPVLSMYVLLDSIHYLAAHQRPQISYPWQRGFHYCKTWTYNVLAIGCTGPAINKPLFLPPATIGNNCDINHIYYRVTGILWWNVWDWFAGCPYNQFQKNLNVNKSMLITGNAHTWVVMFLLLNLCW